MPDTDIAIIGAGAAGLSVAAIAASLGFRTTLIERGAMGGDCLNTGCVPSKALLAVAHLAAEARRAPRYGVVVPPPEIDWALVQAHGCLLCSTFSRTHFSKHVSSWPQAQLAIAHRITPSK